ncbi:MAG: leucine--tRNA ligase [bacterium]
MNKYDHLTIEQKWQDYWEKNKSFEVNPPVGGDNPPAGGKKKYYCLIEFPYASGEGLHAGHPRSYTALDIVSHKRRLEGYNVLYPIGFDSFGLPTENYAIKTKTPPQAITAKNIKFFTRQLKGLGFSFDWSRAFSTADPDYYRWTQWIFIKMWEKGLAYKAKENINWCLKCQIGLANEEVVAGACERCGGEVVKKEKEQWVLRITKYADRLIDDLEQVDYLERIKTQQINWIGRSEGADVDFKVNPPAGGSEIILKVFTTRPDTLFGATFMVVAPEHELISKLKNKIKNIKEVEKYIQQAKKKSDLERTELQKTKTGVELKGVKAINPVNNQEIPIFVADYVLAGYGFGAIMAVPAHDERDFEFAKKYNLPIVEVIKGGDIKKEAYTDIESGEMINSGKFNGLPVKECIKKITAWLEKEGLGKKAVNYHLRDWIFSRQRYWGEPIPMVCCEKCDWQPVAEKDLPVVLPKVKDFMPTEDGESPLAKASDWIKTKCPKCNGPAKRETDVMPNWAGSNWYFIRYCDPKNNQELVGQDKAKYWLPVDWYNGGMEHVTLHLLYSRFVYKFLYDIGAVPKECGTEPYRKRTAQGMVLGEGGIKMSKSKGNVINPDEYVKQYGADTVRLYEMFMGPFDQAIPWDTKGVIGVRRFLDKVWVLAETAGKEKNKELERLLHKTIKKVSNDIETMDFNTAVSQMMIFVNQAKEINQEILEKFLIILAPFAPHLAEELWEKLGNKDSIFKEKWPEYDKKLVKDETISLVIQINGKLRDNLAVPADITEKEATNQALASEKIQKFLVGQKPKKIIFVKGKLINIVI